MVDGLLAVCFGAACQCAAESDTKNNYPSLDRLVLVHVMSQSQLAWGELAVAEVSFLLICLSQQHEPNYFVKRLLGVI